MESLQSQVSQEKELRTVMEGCLMEDKMAWRRVHDELVENHRLAQDMSAMLTKASSCRAELRSHLATDRCSSSCPGLEEKAKGDPAGLKCVALRNHLPIYWG